uniref:Putative secreted protein n=1 Tax=Anopheles marajoara TaxID=58244 RepID=A0A2M4C6L8_9DIPT
MVLLLLLVMVLSSGGRCRSHQLLLRRTIHVRLQMVLGVLLDGGRRRVHPFTVSPLASDCRSRRSSLGRLLGVLVQHVGGRVLRDAVHDLPGHLQTGSQTGGKGGGKVDRHRCKCCVRCVTHTHPHGLSFSTQKRDHNMSEYPVASFWGG